MSDELDFWMESDDEKDIERQIDEESDNVPPKPEPKIIKETPKVESPKQKNVIVSYIDDSSEKEAAYEEEEEQYMVTRLQTKNRQLLHNKQNLWGRLKVAEQPPQPEIKENPEARILHDSFLEIQKQLEKLEEEVDDAEIDACTVQGNFSDDELSDDVVADKKKVFISTEDNSNEWHVYWGPEESFIDVIRVIPEKYRTYDFYINGIPMTPDQIPYDLVGPGERITISPPSVSRSNSSKNLAGKDDEEMRKISFLLPDGTKKKTKISVDCTWGEALEKLGVGKRFMFDGEPLDLSEKICDNSDIEDEDQIDVEA